MRLARHGASLLELVVALALGGLVVGTMTRSSLALRRADRAATVTRAAALAADEAVRVSAELLSRAAAGDSVVVRGDTAIEWRSLVGVAVACFAGGDSVIVPDAGPGAWWEGVPDVGDVLDLGGADAGWESVVVTAVRIRAGGGACGTPHRALVVDSPQGSGGAPLVRVTRWRRLALYRGGDSKWWLGERRCLVSGVVQCDPAQPVAGPLAPPPAGLTFTVEQASGRPRLVRVAARAGLTRHEATVVLRP